MKSRIWPPVPWLEDSLDGNYPPHREAWTSGDSTQKIKIYHRGGEEIMFGARHEFVGFYCLYVYCSGFNVKCKYVWSVTGQAPLTLQIGSPAAASTNLVPQIGSPAAASCDLKLHTLPDKLGLLPQCHSST